MTRPRALLFDLDDTLLDWSGFGAAVARTAELIAAERPGLVEATLAAANASVWAAYWPKVESDWTLGRRDSHAIQREAWRRSLAACGLDDDDLADWARETFAREERASHRLYDDVRGLLDALGDTYRLALITNGARDAQREKLQTVGIAGVFDAVAVSGELGFAKPDPVIFEHVLGLLGVSAGEAGTSGTAWLRTSPAPKQQASARSGSIGTPSHGRRQALNQMPRSESSEKCWISYRRRSRIAPRL